MATKKTATKKKGERFVLVTTDKRGVFAGVLVKDAGQTVTLAESRMCSYWSAKMRGVFGLASMGPDKGCKIGPAVPSQVLNGITSVTDMSPEAVAAWRAEPWG